MKSEFRYNYGDSVYSVSVTYKRGMRNIRYRFRDGGFLVSCPYSVSEKRILLGLDRFAPRMILKNVTRKPVEENGFFYLFGERQDLKDSSSLRLPDGTELPFTSPEEREEGLRKWFLSYLTERNREYEIMMGVDEPYRVRLRDMTSCYGSNSRRSHSISYSFQLVHFSPEIIDSVIVHELAHHFFFNHSSDFYNVVYKYCPGYDALHARLRKAIYR